MKIGHVSLTYRPVFGGQDTYVENLKKVFSEAGHTNTVYQALSYRHEIDPAGVHAIRTLPLLGRWIPNFNWYYFNFFLKLFFRQQLLREDALIVHYAVHYPAVKGHPKIIILSHGMEWHTPPDQWDDALRARRARETYESCTVVANDTEYLRHCGLKIDPKDGYFQEVAPGKWFIPNCVDTTHFKKSAALPEIQALKAILVPRNIYFHRGIHLAIEAFALLVERGNKENHLLIVGKVVDQKYYEGLLELIDRKQIKDRVTFLGHASWDQMPAFYSSSVCTLIPTIDCEGTSLSALESMACGTPVLATNVAGLKDLPCVLADKDPVSFADALSELLLKREKYSKEQLTEVQNTFNLENWAAAWSKVLASVQGER